ncbi:MAG: FAD-binding oxidoreductase [Clostridium perfringens]|nr:FAD-binding oxidoreductase [Clostridium perfringens]
MSDLRWKGFKEVRVVEKEEEGKGTYSYYLKGMNDEILPEYVAGQHIAIRIKNKDNTYTAPRRYTLSIDYRADFYRISVKREENGYISKMLADEINVGDTVEITAPVGKFVLEDNNKDIVLISGGIGITPMLTMAYEGANKGKNIHFIYSTQNPDTHSFKDEVEQLVNENTNMKSTVFYTEAGEGINTDIKYISGRIDKEWIEKNLDKNSEFYFCGPVGFMKAVYHGLIDIGVNKENIHFEMFNSSVDITK